MIAESLTLLSLNVSKFFRGEDQVWVETFGKITFNQS